MVAVDNRKGAAVAASQYNVIINMREGLLEVSGPEKAWVDAKIDQLQPLLSEVASVSPTASPSSAGKRTKPKRGAVDAEASVPPLRRVRGTGGRSGVNADLRARLDPDTKRKFREFIGARRKAWDRSQSAQAAIIATFLHDELGMAGVDQHDIYTAYTVMGERSPANIRSQLTNARQRARYFSGSSDGKMVLSHAGENFARFDSVADDDTD